MAEAGLKDGTEAVVARRVWKALQAAGWEAKVGQGLESLRGSRAWQEAGPRWRQEEERCCRSQSQFREGGREGGGRVGFQALSLGEGPGHGGGEARAGQRAGRASGRLPHGGAHGLPRHLLRFRPLKRIFTGFSTTALELMFHSLQRVFEVTFTLKHIPSN